MSTITVKNLSAGGVLHWIACLSGTALVLLFVVFVIGNQPPLSLLLDPQMWALLVTVGGYLYIWHSNLVGGVLSLAGTAAFFLMNFEKAGNFPSGWVFPLCFIPGALAIAAELLQRRSRAHG